MLLSSVVTSPNRVTKAPPDTNAATAFRRPGGPAPPTSGTSPADWSVVDRPDFDDLLTRFATAVAVTALGTTVCLSSVS